MNPAPSRAALVLDDSPHRVASALGLLRAAGQTAPAAVHVVCSSARAAERMAPVLHRTSTARAYRAEDWDRPRASGLVAGATFLHVLGGAQGRAARDADYCLRAADWLFLLVRDIHRQGFAIDAIAGPNGPLRATLLRGAIESAGTACDRLYLLRSPSAVGAASRANRATSADTLLLINHLPPARSEHARDQTYADLMRRRSREWSVIAAPEPLAVDVAARRITIGATEVSLTPDQTFWYGSFALAPGRIFPHREFGGALRLDGHGRPYLGVPSTTNEGAELHDWLQHLKHTFRHTQPHQGDRLGRVLSNACNLAAPQLGSMLAKVAAALHSAVGAAAERYCVRALKGSGYHLNLPAHLVTVSLPAMPMPRIAISGESKGVGTGADV